MEKEERLTKQIKTVYTEIAKRLVDPSFSFPEGGQAKRQLSKFIVNFTQICGGEFNTSRLVDYCVFQLHKNISSKNIWDYRSSKISINVFQIQAISGRPMVI